MSRQKELIDALYSSRVEIKIPPPKACACGKTPRKSSFDYYRGVLGMYKCDCGQWVSPMPYGAES